MSLTQVLDPTTSFVSATQSQGGCTGGEFVTCALGTIANGGNATVDVTVRAGAAGALSATATVGSPAGDPDGGDDSETEASSAAGTTTTTTYSTGAITVPILDVNAKIRLNHTWDEDLDIDLIHPDGTVQRLSYDNGLSGDNYASGATDCTGTFTTFNDEAGTSIFAGAPPYAGSFWPERLLSLHDGKPLGRDLDPADPRRHAVRHRDAVLRSSTSREPTPSPAPSPGPPATTP